MLPILRFTVLASLILSVMAPLTAAASADLQEVASPDPVNAANDPKDLGVGAVPGVPRIDAPLSLDELLSMGVDDLPEQESIEDHQRALIIRSAGFELGLARGYDHKISAEIQRLKSAEDLLDQNFSFRELFLIANYDMPSEQALHWRPPVITQLEDVVQIGAKGRFLKTIEGVYRIVQDERFVDQPPRWQDYLLAGAIKGGSTVATVSLPRDRAERRLWVESVQRGWQQGVYQATEEIQRRIHRLGRDWNGMLAYVELKLQGKIQSGYVARDAAGVEGGGDEMNVNARTYQITNDVRLNPKSEQWKAIGSKHPTASYESGSIRVFRAVEHCSHGDTSECP